MIDFRASDACAPKYDVPPLHTVTADEAEAPPPPPEIPAGTTDRARFRVAFPML
jgi:hypothetical protein